MTEPSSRVRGLDGLRALAIALVIVDHVRPDFAGGGIGVAVFFTLSGYLITTLLVRERERNGRISLRLFYARRALRLWPALVAMLAVGVLVLGIPVRSALVSGFYLTDIANTAGRITPGLGHTWSLGVEEQFYLLWPLLLPIVVLGGWRRRSAWLLLATAASVLGCWLWTQHSLHETGVIGPGIFNPLWQGHGLLLGCWLALAGQAWRIARPAAVGTVCGAALVGLAVLGSITVDRHWAVGWNLLAEMVTVCLIVAVRDAPGLYAAPPAAWLGQRSYAVYLWHLPLIAYFGARYPHGALIGAAAVLVVAELSAHVVEAPFLRMKDRLHARRLDSVPTSAAGASPLPGTP